MGLIRKMSGTCWTCTERQTGKREDGNRCIRTFSLVRAMVTFPPGTGGRYQDVRDCWECEECGELVPVETMHRYLQTGDIVIPRPSERKRK